MRRTPACFASTVVALGIAWGLGACSDDASVGAMPGNGGATGVGGAAASAGASGAAGSATAGSGGASSGGAAGVAGTAGAAGAPSILCGATVQGVHPGCAPMDATGYDNSCQCIVGWAWDGTACRGVGGCACIGVDCANLYSTDTACAAAHASCPGPDGGADGASDGGILCGTKLANLHAKCAPMDAKGQGACFCFIGYAWNGTACVEIGGCECAGADCKDMFEDKNVCDAAHEHCLDAGGGG